MKKLLLLSTLAVATVASAQTKKLHVITNTQGTMRTFEVYQKQTDGLLSLLNSKEEDGGRWTFDSLAAGTYRVRLGVGTDTKYLDTWYPAALLWDEAQDITIAADTTGSTDTITVQILANPAAFTGPGRIGGVLTEGLMKAAGDPLKNVSVIIKDSNNAVVKVTKSDSTGTFNATDLPLGTLKVIVNALNASTANPKIITLDSTNMSDTAILLTVNRTGTNYTGIATVAKAKNITLYPNPATDLLYVNSEKAVTVSVYDVTGKMLLNETVSNTNPLSLQSLSNGMYIVRIQAGEQVSTQRLIKQ